MPIKILQILAEKCLPTHNYLWYIYSYFINSIDPPPRESDIFLAIYCQYEQNHFNLTMYKSMYYQAKLIYLALILFLSILMHTFFSCLENITQFIHWVQPKRRRTLYLTQNRSKYKKVTWIAFLTFLMQLSLS